MKRTICTAIAYVCLLSPALQAQVSTSDLQHDLQGLLENKILTLRGMYRSEKLHFAADGHPLSPAEPGFGPSDAKFHVDRVRLQNDRLTLDGDLPVIFYDTLSGKITYSAGFDKRVVEIDLASLPTSSADAVNRLWTVFFSPGEQILPPCSAEESAAFLKSIRSRIEKTPKKPAPPNPGPPETKPDPPKSICLPNGERVNTIAHGTVPPQATFDPEPTYTELAKRHRLSGTVIVHTVIDVSGKAASLMIVRPLGDGLDEAAVKAIRTWRFAPAKMNQEPVAVPVKIEVTFHM